MLNLGLGLKLTQVQASAPPVAPPANSINQEDGTALLLEDGTELLLEA